MYHKYSVYYNYVCYRDDYKFSEMIRPKALIATLVPNLIGHPYVALERQYISGQTLSMKNVRCQTVIIISVLYVHHILY